MKFYTDKDKVTMVQTITSASTFVSSITGIIKNHILKVFPKEYFKYIYMDTSETYQEHNKTDANNKYLHKIAYPTMSISPQLSIDNPVGGMKNILMSSPNFWIPRDLNRQFPCLLEDPNGKYKIYFTSDYTTMNLRFKIVTDSFIQATEIGYYLKSRFNDETFKYLSNQTITAEVPKSFINAIAKIENLFGANSDEITNKEDLRKLDVLMLQLGRRAKTIMRKRSMNNRKMSYYFEEKSNLLTLFADLDIPEGVVRDNSVNGEYEINFRVQISAWWPNAFIMVVNKDQYQMLGNTVTAGTISDKFDSNMIYSTSIGSPLVLDRKDSMYFEDSKGDMNIGINVLHEVYEYPYTEASNKINISKMIWGE